MDKHFSGKDINLDNYCQAGEGITRMSDIESKYVIASTRGILKKHKSLELALLDDTISELVIYDCFLILFSINFNNQENIGLPIIPYFDEPVYDELGSPPFRYFHRFLPVTSLIRLIVDLDKDEKGLLLELLKDFLNFTSIGNYENFVKLYFSSHHKYTFENYEDTLKAFRSFLVWFDLQLYDFLLKNKNKSSEKFHEIQMFVKEMIEKLPGSIEIDNLPQNPIELIQIYNSDFYNLIAEKAIEI